MFTGVNNPFECIILGLQDVDEMLRLCLQGRFREVEAVADMSSLAFNRYAIVPSYLVSGIGGLMSRVL